MYFEPTPVSLRDYYTQGKVEEVRVRKEICTTCRVTLVSRDTHARDISSLCKDF